MNREELTECHRGGEKVTEEDQSGAMGLEYVNIDEHRKTHAELVARAWHMYDERRPLFTREMIVDAQKQIDDLNAGRFADVDGLPASKCIRGPLKLASCSRVPRPKHFGAYVCLYMLSSTSCV